MFKIDMRRFLQNDQFDDNTLDLSYINSNRIRLRSYPSIVASRFAKRVVNVLELLSNGLITTGLYLKTPKLEPTGNK